MHPKDLWSYNWSISVRWKGQDLLASSHIASRRVTKPCACVISSSGPLSFLLTFPLSLLTEWLSVQLRVISCIYHRILHVEFNYTDVRRGLMVYVHVCAHVLLCLLAGCKWWVTVSPVQKTICKLSLRSSLWQNHYQQLHTTTAATKQKILLVLFSWLSRAILLNGASPYGLTVKQS